MEFEAIIGLEIHVEMKTKSKMFSPSPVTFGADPNTELSPLDLAFPGTMPVVNKQAVINAIRVSNALHMSIDNELHFDRKNYFYSDLPKGYQITQQDRPIGKNGYLTIDLDGQEKRINIERLHMEEDTCKQLHSWDCSLVDYNRAGIPLIEIVSCPDMRSGEEAMKYAEKIRSIVSFLDVSDGKMEEGSLRCDVNISIREVGCSVFGTKVEIKNLNSFQNIKKSIDFEIARQKAIIECGGTVIQETRRFDEGSQETVLMRVKTDSVDYKYFAESNITPISLSDEFIKEAIDTSNELADSRLMRYKQFGLNDHDCLLLLSNKDISDYYDFVVKSGANPKLAANWILVDVQTILNKDGLGIKDFIISSNNLGKLICLVESNKVSNKQGREVFAEMLKNNDDPEKIINSLGLSQLSNEDDLKTIICEICNQNPQSIVDFKAGKDRALGFLVGKVMQQTKGKANPGLTSKLILEEIQRR